MKQTQVLFLELSGIFFKYFLPICGFKLKPSMETSERDEVAKGQVPLSEAPDLPLEKPLCRSGSNS